MGLGKDFELDKILSECSLERQYISNTDLDENELKEIFDDFIKASSDLEKLYKNEFENLVTNVPGVHSISGRIKDPNHLIGKIIRNSNDKPDKYHGITKENYYKLITDLVGFRIIVLDKNDWGIINDALNSLYKKDPTKYINAPEDYLKNYKPDEKQPAYYAEKPKVYITASDSEDEIIKYEQAEIEVDKSRNNYRSLHYIIKKEKFYFEIQVRSLFEEGWLEFEHRVLYPNDRKNQRKKEYVQILNNLSKAADGIISFYDRYQDAIPNVVEDEANKGPEKVNENISGFDYVDQLDFK